MSQTTGRTPSRRKSDRHEVREAVQEMILTGELEPGSKLLQMNLAKQFEVTQNVVREALLELQACGLVQARDNRGIFVGDISVEKFLEFLDVRAMLEGLAARLCCERISRFELRELRDVAEEIKRAGVEKRIQDDIELDTQFHIRMMEIAGNSVLVQIAQTFWPLTRIVAAESVPSDTFDQHIRIVDAIEAGKPQQAERAAREHIDQARKLMLQSCRMSQS